MAFQVFCIVLVKLYFWYEKLSHEINWARLGISLTRLGRGEQGIYWHLVCISEEWLQLGLLLLLLLILYDFLIRWHNPEQWGYIHSTVWHLNLKVKIVIQPSSMYFPPFWPSRKNLWLERDWDLSCKKRCQKLGRNKWKVFFTWTNQSWCPQLICKLSWDKLSGTLPSSSLSSALPSRGTQVRNMCTWDIILDKVFLSQWHLSMM